VAAAAAVRITDTTVQGNFSSGILLDGGATAAISHSKLLDNGLRGVWVFVQSAVTTSADISDSFVTGNDVGVQATGNVSGSIARMAVARTTVSNSQFGVASVANVGATAVLSISDSMVTRNISSGLFQLGAGATLETLGNNNMRQNGANSGTITTVAPS
jgi:hypothetical protein